MKDHPPGTTALLGGGRAVHATLPCRVAAGQPTLSGLAVSCALGQQLLAGSAALPRSAAEFTGKKRR
jgi:hypothetical protein